MPGKSSLGSGKRLPSGGKKGQGEVEEAKKFLFWPEWTDAELNAEKWDTSGKGKDKGKAGSALYDDLDQPHLPSCLAASVVEWKRPAQFFQDKDGQSELNPVVVSSDKVEVIDLISCNQHILISKLMCRIIVELHLLWRLRNKFRPINLPENDPGTVEAWLPWQHIYPWPKGHATPTYNPQGKYCVKVYWMGKWRKVTVDDQLPVDSSGRILLPVSTHEGELWPLLITKALLKIINLEGVDGEQCDTTVIQSLTGWFGEDVSLSDQDSWSLIQPLLKPWERESTANQTRSEQNEKEDSSNTIVIGFYHPSKETLNRDNLFVSMSDHAHPIILSKWRNEPLELPPLEPPLPSLQSPYYLGLSHRKPRPGYPLPPPPKTDHRSFEMYSPLYCNKTTNSKSELSSNTDNTAAVCHQADVWIDLDEFEATFRKIMIFQKSERFQRIDYDNLPPTSASSVAPPAGLKKSITMHEEQQPHVTGNILMIDHSEDDPVTVYINYSSISSWYEGGKEMGLEPVTTLGIKRVHETIKDDSEGIDHSTVSVPPEENKETNEVDSHHQLSEGKPLSLVPGSLIIQEYTWHHNEGTVCYQDRFSNGVPRIITTGSQTISLRFPKGRCVLKLLMSAPLGYHVSVYSTIPLIMCKEEEILIHLKKPSLYYLSHGEKIVDMLTDIESDSDNNIIELLLQNTPHKHLTKNDFKALRVSLLRVLHVLGPEVGLGSSQLFAWKSRVLKIMEQIRQRQAKNEDNVKQEEDEGGDGIINMIAMREAELFLGGRGIKPHDHDKNASSDTSGRRSNQLKKQKAIDGEQEVVANEGEELHNDDDDDDNNNMTDELKDSIKCIQDHRKELGVAIIQCLHAAKPDVITKSAFGFGTTINNRVFHATYQGTLPCIESNGWTLLFRDVFTVPCKQTIAFKLSSTCVSCIVKMINNDNGVVLGNDLEPMEVITNKNGYTLIGEAWSFGDTLEGKDNWTLTLMSSSPHLPTLVSGKDASIITSFHVVETKKYYLPNREFIIFRYSLTVSDECHVTIQLNTSKRDACFKLEVLDCNKLLATVDGIGHCVMPSLHLTTEENEGSDESSLGKSHRYIMQAIVLYDSWTVGDSAWPYISTIKNVQREVVQSNKPSSGKKNKNKVGGSKTPKPSSASHDTVDTTKPHWILRVITDSKDSQTIKVEEDKSKEEELKMMQQVWERDQPGRAKKAQQARQKFLDSHSLSKEDLATDNGDRSGDPSTNHKPPHFGPIPLKPINQEQYIVLSCDEHPSTVINNDLETERQSARLNTVTQYREWRKEVLLKREIEANHRYDNKMIQLKLAEDWQLQLDETRNKLNESRESIRERNTAKQTAKSPAEDVPAGRPPSKGKDTKGKAAKGKKK